MDPVTGGIIAGNVMSGLGSSWMGYQTNKENVASQEKMNQRQWELQQWWRDQDREWSLADWNRVTAYNSPVQQMQRLREAGLNPNLVYGKGAENTATMVRSASGMSPGGQAPHRQAIPIPNIGNMIADAVQASNQNRIAAVQIENLKQDGVLKKQAEMYRDIEMIGLLTKNKQSAFNLQLSQELKDSVLLGAELKNKKLESERQSIDMRTKLEPLRFELQKQQTALQNVKTKAETQKILGDIAIQNWKTSTEYPENLKLMMAKVKTEEFKQKAMEAQTNLEKLGISKNDPIYIRLLGASLGKILSAFE